MGEKEKQQTTMGVAQNTLMLSDNQFWVETHKVTGR